MAETKDILVGTAGLVIGFLGGLASGMVIARPSNASSALNAESSAHPASAPVAAPTAAPLPTAPLVVAPVSADLAIAQRIARSTGPDLDAALCAIERQADPDATFASLERNSARFNAHLAVFRGKVLQIEDRPDGRTFFRLALDSYAQRVVAVFAYVRPPESVVLNRRVKVYGRLAGRLEYTSTANWQISIPRLDAVGVVLADDAPRCPRR